MGSPIKQAQIDLGYELIFITVASALLAGLLSPKSSGADTA